MPDISDLPLDRLAVRMKEALTGDRGRGFPETHLWTNLARLVDRALVCYRDASAYLDKWIATSHQGNQSARFRAIGAMEECVTLTHRGVLHATALDRDLSNVGRDCMSVRYIRDAIQQTEDRLLGHREPLIEKGEYPFLAFGDTALVIGKQSLEYESLARVLRALHQSVEP